MNGTEHSSSAHEMVPHANNYAAEIIGYVGMDERWADLTQRRDLLSCYGETDFIDLVQRIDALVRTGEPEPQQSFDRPGGNFLGDSNVLQEHRVPDAQDAEELLGITWGSCLRFLEDLDLTDEQALELTGLTAAGAIILTHPFIDSNGRTSRALSYLLMTTEPVESELFEILQHSNGGSAWNIAPQPLGVRPRPTYRGDQPDIIHLQNDRWDNPTLQVLESVHSVEKEKIIRQFIEWYGSEAAELRSACTTIDEHTGRKQLDGDDFLMWLLSGGDEGEQIANTRGFIAAYREVRAEQVVQFVFGMLRNQTISVLKDGEFPAPSLEPYYKNGKLSFRDYQRWGHITVSSLARQTDYSGSDR